MDADGREYIRVHWCSLAVNEAPMQPNHKGQSPLTMNTLAKLHIAKKVLCLDDDAYRLVLERVTGQRSARFITPEDLPALQRELRRLGWDGYLMPHNPPQSPFRKGGGSPLSKGGPGGILKYEELGNRRGMPTPAQLRKFDALFNTTPGYGTINPKAAMRGFLKKRFGVEDVRFLDVEQFEKALNAIRQIRERKGVSRDGDL
jgi:hypothetical protein